MAWIFPGKLIYFLLPIVLVICPVDRAVAQDFYQPPPILYNKLAQNPIEMADQNISLLDGQAEKKSVPGAFFLSLLLPGLGEAYVGKTTYTKVFLGIEALGWGLFIANEIQVATREEDYKNYAAQHADVVSNNKDDQFWIDIGKYNNIYEYNEQRRRERNVPALYTENRHNFWLWDLEVNRLSYDAQRIKTKEIDERKTFILGGIILNHLVSAINALRLARIHNRQIDELGWHFDVELDPRLGQLSLGFTKAF